MTNVAGCFLVNLILADVFIQSDLLGMGHNPVHTAEG